MLIKVLVLTTGMPSYLFGKRLKGLAQTLYKLGPLEISPGAKTRQSMRLYVCRRLLIDVGRMLRGSEGAKPGRDGLLGA